MQPNCGKGHHWHRQHYPGDNTNDDNKDKDNENEGEDDEEIYDNDYNNEENEAIDNKTMPIAQTATCCANTKKEVP